MIQGHQRASHNLSYYYGIRVRNVLLTVRRYYDGPEACESRSIWAKFNHTKPQQTEWSVTYLHDFGGSTVYILNTLLHCIHVILQFTSTEEARVCNETHVGLKTHAHVQHIRCFGQKYTISYSQLSYVLLNVIYIYNYNQYFLFFFIQ